MQALQNQSPSVQAVPLALQWLCTAVVDTNSCPSCPVLPAPQYATRTGVVERLFAGNGGAAARDLDSVLASPLPQTLSGIPVVAKVPKPPGAAAKVERQLELALRPPRRSVAIPGSAEAGLQRDALVAGARAQLTGTAAVAAVSAGSVAAQPPLGAAPASAAVAQRTCIAAGATGAAAATFAAAATAPAAQAGPVPVGAYQALGMSKSAAAAWYGCLIECAWSRHQQELVSGGPSCCSHSRPSCQHLTVERKRCWASAKL